MKAATKKQKLRPMTPPQYGMHAPDETRREIEEKVIEIDPRTSAHLTITRSYAPCIGTFCPSKNDGTPAETFRGIIVRLKIKGGEKEDIISQAQIAHWFDSDDRKAWARLRTVSAIRNYNFEKWGLIRSLTEIFEKMTRDLGLEATRPHRSAFADDLAFQTQLKKWREANFAVLREWKFAKSKIWAAVLSDRAGRIKRCARRWEETPKKKVITEQTSPTKINIGNLIEEVMKDGGILSAKAITALCMDRGWLPADLRADAPEVEMRTILSSMRHRFARIDPTTPTDPYMYAIRLKVKKEEKKQQSPPTTNSDQSSTQPTREKRPRRHPQNFDLETN